MLIIYQKLFIIYLITRRFVPRRVSFSLVRPLLLLHGIYMTLTRENRINYDRAAL